MLPKSLAADEVESVLQGPPRVRDDRRSQALALRDRAMLEVFYAGALRVSEIASMKLEDLKLELGYVLVRGKGDKERIVPLGQAAQETCSNICATRVRCWRQGSRRRCCSSRGARAASPASGFGRW